MSVTATIAVEAELSADNWTAITADVLSAHGLTAEYGIRGQRPTDRVAQVGNMKFVLDNSVGNIGTAQGYYAPDNASVASGWDLSTAIRLKITYGGTDYYKFLGKISDLDVKAGTKKERDVKVTVEDWMRDATEAKIQLLAVQENLRTDQVIDVAVSAMEVQPRATSYATAQETLPSALDDVKDGRTSVLAVIQKAIISEYGFFMHIGDTTGGGTAKLQDRHARVKDRTVQITLTADDIADLKYQHDKTLIFNEVRAKVFPRDEGDSVEILGCLDSSLEIAAGATDTIRLQYRDPNLLDARLSGKNLYDAEGKNELVEQEDASARGFEVDAGGWVKGSMVSAARSTDQAKAGSASLLATTDTGAANNYRTESELLTGFVQDDVIYTNAWVYIPSAWPVDVALFVEEYDSGDVVGTTTSVDTHDGTLTAGWYRLSGQHTVVDADAAKIKLIVGSSEAGDFSGGAVTVYIDECYVIHDSELNFSFSATEADDGGSLNDYLELIGSTIGGSGAEYVPKNTGSVSGHLAVLKARGTAIRLYNPIERVAMDATSQTKHNEKSVPLNLAYQSDTRTGQDFADVTLSKYKDPHGWVKSVTFHANRSDALMTAALAVEPGMRVAITEAVSGLSASEFFVNAVKLKIYNKGFIDCTWFVVPASTEQYWLCGTAGASEIGITTYVGF